MVRFQTGSVYMTQGINEKTTGNDILQHEVFTALQRHVSGDWGDMESDDLSANWEALRDGLRLFSAYETTGGKIWIITEADRSATTILFPHEY